MTPLRGSLGKSIHSGCTHKNESSEKFITEFLLRFLSIIFINRKQKTNGFSIGKTAFFQIR